MASGNDPRESEIKTVSDLNSSLALEAGEEESLYCCYLWAVHHCRCLGRHSPAKTKE